MDRHNIGHHISQQFNEELEDIRNKVLAMGGMVEQQLTDAISAVITGDGRLGEVVVTNAYNDTKTTKHNTQEKKKKEHKNKTTKHQLITFMMEDPRSITRVLDVI